MDNVIMVLGTGIAFLVLLVFPGVAAHYIVSRFGGSPDRVGEGALTCPRCAAAVVRLEADRVTPYPGYECRACGLTMRPPRTRGFYIVVLMVCAVLLVLSALASWESRELVWFPCALTVAGYSVYQLLRPVPVRRQASDHRE
jgi:hypothetical protein